MDRFHIQWHITEKCNLQCLHCYREPWRKEFGFDKLKLVADKIIFFVTTTLKCKLVITLTGGEPFLKPEVYKLAEYLDKFDVVETINFITNGTVIPRQQLKNVSKLGKIYISVESNDEELNDVIRGKGVFQKVITNLEWFSENYDIGIMTTLLNTNIGYLTENFLSFIKFFFIRGVKEIIFERFIPVGEARKVQHEVLTIDKILLFYSQIANVLNINFDELKLYPAIKLVNYQKDKFNINKIEVYGAECICGKDGFAILPDGTVYPCRRWDNEIYNFVNTSETTSLKKFFTNFDMWHKKNKLDCSNMFYCYAWSNFITNSSFSQFDLID